MRCGLIDAARYVELLGRTITTVLRTPGRLTQSVADSSFDAWIKYYRPDENSPNAVVSYYAKGTLVACALDLTLRRDGRSSLDEVMRALWERHGRTAIGVPEDGIPALASELAGRDLSDFFARYVHGTEDPPLRDLLAEFGITLDTRVAFDAKDRGGKRGSGTPPRCSFDAKIGGDLKLAVVFRDGAAARAGLSANDTLVAIDGLKVSAEALVGILARRQPGEEIAVHAFRRDELMEFTVTLAHAPQDTVFLTLDDAPSSAALARRTAWLCPSP